ncbi:MAG: MCE family protein [Candidatus Cloacimonetes bacterium]|nr:MCE family protein [Candidatus Cloacimonadota bacterium]
MITKAQKVRLGIFIAIGCTLILMFAGVVAGSQLLQKRDIYYIEYEDVSVHGLQVGGAVLYHGIKVGRVESIKINPDDVSKIIITISVEAGTPIKEDVLATLVPVGITGLKSIELKGGSNEAKLVKLKTFLKTGVSTFDSITGKAESIAEKIDLIASNISNMTNEENQKNIALILEETSLLLQDTRTNLSGTLNSLNKIASSTAEIAGSTATNLDKLTNTTNKQIEDIGTNLNKSITDMTNNTNLLLTDTRKQISMIGDNSNQLIMQTTKDIALMTTSINSSLNRINQIVNTAQFDSLIVNVNTISGKLASSDLKQLVTDLNATIVQTNSLVSNLDRTVTRGRTDLLETLESLREAAENLNEFSKQISENPSLLLIGK